MKRFSVVLANSIFLVLAYLLQACGGISFRADKLNADLPCNDSMSVVFADGFNSDQIVISGLQSRVINTDEITGVACDIMLQSEGLTDKAVLIDSKCVMLHNFDCRYSQIVIRNLFSGIEVEYNVEARSFD